MAFKYQVSLALCPKDILLITLNHMDAIRNFVKGQSNIEQQVDHVYRLLLEVGRQDFVWDLGVIKTSLIILSIVSHRPVLGEAKMEDHSHLEKAHTQLQTGFIERSLSCETEVLTSLRMF